MKWKAGRIKLIESLNRSQENRIRTHAWDAREIIPPLQLCEPVTNLIARWCAFLSLPSLLSTFFASPRVENRRGG